MHHRTHYQDQRVQLHTDKHANVDCNRVALLFTQEYLATQLNASRDNHADTENVEHNKEAAAFFVSLLTYDVSAEIGE